MSTPEQASNWGGSSSGEQKKKQPPFWEREIKVENCEDINHGKFMLKLHSRFSKAFIKCKRQSRFLKCTNLLVTLLIVAVQVAQVVIFQIPDLSSSTKNAIATILPTATGAIFAVQLKLGWEEKALKCKKCAGLYNKLANNIKYRLDAMEAGGRLTDTVKVWNTALISKSAEVPPFLMAY